MVEPKRDDTGRRWYTVYTQLHREFRAQAQLQNQNYHVYLPRRNKTVRHARKLKMVPAAFFPRYLFIALDLAVDQWRNVNNTFGVCSLIMAGEQPRPVPQGVVEAMIAATDSEGLLSFERDLKIGDQVRFLAGPFADRLGTIERLDDIGRVRVLLDIMGGRVPVRLPRAHVIAT
jgi:transcription elongation factor/antiterminator RfaH